ncbi:MAG: SMR family transporter [Rhodomicrobium sp.]|jgi:multidrug transporter EmrE-like cation transporter
MRFDSIALIVASVVLSSVSQIFIKSGMTAPDIRHAIESGGVAEIAFKIATSPAVLSGLGCFGLSFMLWLFVLSRVPLSSAYPFVALGIMLTVLAGSFIFAEPISLAKTVGVCLVIGGVVLVGLAG